MSGSGHSLQKGDVRDTSASLIGRLGSSAFRLSTTTVSMSLAGSCFSSESAPRPLYGVSFVKYLARAATLSFAGFLVRSQSPFLRPDLRIDDVDARRICTRLAVTPPRARLNSKRLRNHVSRRLQIIQDKRSRHTQAFYAMGLEACIDLFVLTLGCSAGVVFA